MKHLKLYEHFFKPVITLNRESTGQKMDLDESESLQGNDAISTALKSKSIGNDIGLVAPDFTVSVFGKELEVYSQGQLIKDEQGEYHNFEYGKKWYNMFTDELKDILEKNPRHFLGESISDKLKHLKSYNENKIEWTRYFSFSEADEHLKESFIDFISPIDDSAPAKVTHTQVGRDVMAFWVISIPINTKGHIDKVSSKITSMLEEIKGCIGKAETRLDIGHQIDLESVMKLSVLQEPIIRVSIWSNSKD
jgi:hypothetical protein